MASIVLGAASMRHPLLDDSETLPNTIDPRLAEAQELVDEALSRGCELLCLPELFADPTQGTRMSDFAEPLGGPVTSWLADTAKATGMALATSVTLQREHGVTNTGVVYDEHGRLTGSYDKVHLPPGECDVATPGDDFPVFELHGIRIGMQICYDLEFPEGCRILAIKGAQIILWPNMWGGMPEERTEVILKARAMENGVCIVSAGFFLDGPRYFRAPKLYGRTCVVDPKGTILSEVGRRTGVAVASLPLDDLRSGGEHLFERRPGTYGDILLHAQSPTQGPSE